MKKTYRTDDFSSKIEVFEVVKETTASVWVKTDNSKKPEQFRKFSGAYNFFDTIEEAKKHLTDRYIKDIEYHKKQIERSNEAIKKVQEIE